MVDVQSGYADVYMEESQETSDEGRKREWQKSLYKSRERRIMGGKNEDRTAEINTPGLRTTENPG